jgi:hypothetical protein
MNIDRLEKLMQSYGVHEKNWPEQERAAARLLIESNPLAAQLVTKYEPLDRLLDSYQPLVPMDLDEKILAQLPQSIFDRFLSWLIPDSRAHLWRPALAASFTLVIGILISSTSLGQLLPLKLQNSNTDVSYNELSLIALDDSTDIALIVRADDYE